jgi:hypothetical protein
MNNTLPTPIHSPHILPKSHSFYNLPEKQQDTPTTPKPKILRLHISTYESKFYTLERILKSIDGRDKSMKIIQYIIKILLYHNVVSSKRWTCLATQFSITRQILCLGNASSDIHELFSPTTTRKSTAFKKILLINSISNAISDDIYCLYRIGILPKRWGDYSEVISAHCWFLSIMQSLRTNYIKMCQLEAENILGCGKDIDDQENLRLAQVAVYKSMADFAFCGIIVIVQYNVSSFINE